MSRSKSALIVFFAAVLFSTVTWSKKIPDGSIDEKIRESIYSGHEVLKYTISWSGGIKIGNLHLEVQKDAQEEEQYSIHARVKDSGIFHFFYPVNDTFITVVKGEKRLPVRYDVEQVEGSSYHARRHTEYDQQQGVAHYRKNDNPVETYSFSGEVHNEFSSFLYTRMLKLEKDKPVIVPTFADEKRHAVVVQTGDATTINNTLLGSVTVLPVSPLMDFKGLYDKAGDTVIYFSDDICRIPVRIVSKILIGSITAELVSYSSSTCKQYSSHQTETPLKIKKK